MASQAHLERLQARLERLRHTVQADLEALPTLTPEPILSDSDSAGGVKLDPLQTPGDQSAANTVRPGNIPSAPESEPNPDRRYVWLPDAESSYNPTALPAPVRLTNTVTSPPSTLLPCTDLNRGDLGSATKHYCPIVALSRYPYKWCNKTHSQDIAAAFFDQGKFWTREWDLYYVWDIDDHVKPLVLVHEAQVQTLLAEINSRLKLSLRITGEQREDALVSRFPDHPRCRPRYLGRSRSRAEYDSMAGNAPEPGFRAAGEPEGRPLDGRSLEAFKKLMAESFEAQKAKSKAMRAKKQQARLLKHKTLSDQFKRTQRYLGLRPTANVAVTGPGGPPPAIDPKQPTPFTFDQSVVFVCVDVESYERAHHKITEVGIATLDTGELSNVPPGVDGENWRRYVRARHFRIKENAHLVNTDFVRGCPDRFDYGQSTMVSLDEAPKHIAACFSPPFGAHHSNGDDGIEHLMGSMSNTEKRNLIFLGHDTLGDVKYLQNLGYDPLNIDNLLEALDTAVMYRVWRREQNPTALDKILNDFDIAGFNVHNAGNDAVFTVQAMLAICVREASIRGSTEMDNQRRDDRDTRRTAALEEAEQRVKGDAEGWSDYELEGDGGPPVPLTVNPPAPGPSQSIFNGQNRVDKRGTSKGGRGEGPRSAAYDTHEQRQAERGRADRFQRGGNRSYTRGGHVENSNRGRERGCGRGRGRGIANTPPTDNAPDDPVHYNW
ncbi:hypothetical protein B5807_11871 [Epicoccum nigrum]|uniref:Gfd2/YDR514C-like C-terminal domain-containing protein n=1 Tax=Epicoccum nigrum TaxID=105696 RepID=A0A1Y2LIE5_EPING|nr:hypothetical protein B5807_11871 [Epicoccum nigrum]